MYFSFFREASKKIISSKKQNSNHFFSKKTEKNKTISHQKKEKKKLFSCIFTLFFSHETSSQLYSLIVAFFKALQKFSSFYHFQFPIHLKLHYLSANRNTKTGITHFPFRLRILHYHFLTKHSVTLVSHDSQQSLFAPFRQLIEVCPKIMRYIQKFV